MQRFLENSLPTFIITEELRLFYYRGLQNWGYTNGYLRDTCLTAQDHYKALLDLFQNQILNPKNR